MKEAYLSECLEKFHELPEQIQEMVGGFEACLLIKKLEEAYNVSLSFAVILVVINELNIDDLPEYLNLKFKLDLKKGEEITAKLDESIFSPVLDLILDEEVAYEDDLELGLEDEEVLINDLSLEEKKELVLNIFSNKLVESINLAPSKIKELNILLFQTFNEDEDLESKVESLLYTNQEKLSDHQIILDGHPASPSVANWLKDFIKKYGSDLFNEVTLAEYLSQSPNIKSVKPEERELIKKVLKLYRNLVFFPESMDGVPLENWEIIPTGNVVKTKIEQENISENPVISERQKTIFDLQKNLTKYSSTSLEYKAIQQEINRLSRK